MEKQDDFRLHSVMTSIVSVSHCLLGFCCFHAAKTIIFPQRHLYFSVGYKQKKKATLASGFLVL